MRAPAKFFASQQLAYEENKGFTDLGWVEPYNNRYYPSYEELVYENIFEISNSFLSIYKACEISFELFFSQTVGTQRIWPARAFTLGQLTHDDLASVRIAKRATKSL